MSSAVVEGTSPATGAGSIPKLNLQPVIFLGALWAWAIYTLSGYWKDFEQYSYGYFVPPLAAYFVWRRIALFASAHPSNTIDSSRRVLWPMFFAAVLILPLEYLRLALPAARGSAWAISMVAIICSLSLAYQLGGRKLLRSIAFPLFFFLTAAPWFAFLEKSITLGLMEYVAAIVTELLHLGGIQARAQGTMISMAPGMLGIAEACSGIRSLQSGLMYSLAVGELFLLSTGRRITLVGLTVLCGFILNLARTFTLAYQTDLHGLEIIEKIHDQIGITTSLILPVAVWGIGRLLAGPEPEPSRDAERPTIWIRRRLVGASASTLALVLAVLAFLPCHVWLLYQDATVAHQTKPYFVPRLDSPQNSSIKPDPEVWKTLNPTSGGYLKHDDPALPMGRADGYYFFWDPRKDNFNILWHHPERCMVGAGWQPNGPTEEVEVNLNGSPVHWFAFLFRNDRTQVVQLWGAWRNGVPIVGNKTISLRNLSGLMKQLRLFSRGNSATEIVSFTVPYEGDKPPIEEAKAVVTKMFDYTGNPGK